MEQEDTIDYNLRKTWNKIQKMYNHTASEYEGNMSLAMLVLNIDIYDGTLSTQLGPLMGMEATSISRSLNRLEKMGIIERQNDLNDKRKVKIHLTDLGKKRRKIAKKTVIDFNESILKHFHNDEIKIFFQILKKINIVLDKKKQNEL